MQLTHTEKRNVKLSKSKSIFYTQNLTAPKGFYEEKASYGRAIYYSFYCGNSTGIYVGVDVDWKWQPHHFSLCRCQKRGSKSKWAAHIPHSSLKCNEVFCINLHQRSTQPPNSFLLFFWKMINYCFQGKHKKDMKNAQDRRTIAIASQNKKIQSCVTRSFEKRDEQRRRRCAAEMLVWQHKINNLCVNRNLFILFMEGFLFVRSLLRRLDRIDVFP